MSYSFPAAFALSQLQQRKTCSPVRIIASRFALTESKYAQSTKTAHRSHILIMPVSLCILKYPIKEYPCVCIDAMVRTMLTALATCAAQRELVCPVLPAPRQLSCHPCSLRLQAPGNCFELAPKSCDQSKERRMAATCTLDGQWPSEWPSVACIVLLLFITHQSSGGFLPQRCWNLWS